MGVAILVIGKSGSGKSYSLRNMPMDRIGVFNILGKPYPFRGKVPKLDHATYKQIMRELKDNKRKCYVIDDSTYLMQLENFDRALETGFGKYTEMAYHFEKLIEAAIKTDEETIVYFMHHPEFDERGDMKPKTIGKMIDEKFEIPGAFPMAIQCAVVDGKHLFLTKNDGYNNLKCPPGMLPDEMDNDLYEVDKAAREYWGFAPLEGGKDAE